MSDLIDRQAAIDALDKRFDSIPMEQTAEILQLRKDLRELPSAQPETHDERTETHACDLISRAAVIDEIVNTVSEIGLHDNSEVARYGATFRQHEIIDIIEGMPSAQPSSSRGHENDTISRRAAIDAVHKNYDVILDFTSDGQTISSSIEDILSELPSSQPERKTGRWIPHEDEDGEHYGDKCSECGEWYVMPYGKTSYCPNCGADMREVDDGSD